MTAEREAMTLEQASDLLTEWLPICAGTEATKAWSVVRAYLSRAAEPVAILAKHQPCGCVVCTCDDDDRCHGCGAKDCGTHPGKPIPNPIYTRPSEDARDAERYRWLRMHAVEGCIRSSGATPDLTLNCDEPASEWDAQIDAAMAKENCSGSD